MKLPPEPSGVIDPNQVGPFHVCLRCFTPESDELTFCQMCGRIKGFFQTPLEIHGEHCFVHNTVLASTYCVLCGRPICRECNEREGVSFVSGLPTPQCRSCLDKSRKLEADFLDAIKHNQSCTKHRDRSGTFTCVSCSLPHCPQCSYFLTGGLFKPRIKAGPYCLACFRTSHAHQTRRRWMSGARILTAGLMPAEQ
jgi:hypothetical protein